MGEGKPLGTVCVYLWCIEVQERGSPHALMLQWIKYFLSLSNLSERTFSDAMRHFVHRVVCAGVRADMIELE